MTAGAGERARELAQKVVRDLLGTDDYESEETMQHVTARLAAVRLEATSARYEKIA